MIDSQDYLRLLLPWPAHVAANLYSPPSRPDLACYGTGYNGWGVQTHQKALAALAVLAADPDYDSRPSGLDRRQVVETALRMLRFSLASHISGGFHCTDGQPWGHTWISALGVERMMHGVEALAEHLTAEDRAGLRTMLLSECDWLTDEYEIVAGPVENNKPESNLWNGAILHRTAAMFPDAPRAGDYRRKGTAFLLNAISIPSDASDETPFAGRPLRQWHVGANFFDSLALNHHRYLNVGYMIICLSNAAMLEFFYRTRGLEAPPEGLHHARELWRLCAAMTFPDGRLCRIGGDTRVRYAYCQDYAIPTWLLAAGAFGHGWAASFERRWLEQVGREQRANGDGTFLSGRCAELARRSPLYYTRLESDRAVTLSMGAYWRRVLDLPAGSDRTPAEDGCDLAEWSDAYHGAAFSRGRRRIASCVFDAAEAPQVLCVPTDDSSLAEWRLNLAPRVTGEGRVTVQRPVASTVQTFAGGFLAVGRSDAHTMQMVAEGQAEMAAAEGFLAVAALPDDATVLVIQYVAAPPHRVLLRRIEAVGLMIPNDVFNDYRRTIHSPTGRHSVRGFGAEPGRLDLGGRWATIDDRLALAGAYGFDRLELFRPGRRQVGLRIDAHKPAATEAGGMLYCDVLRAAAVDELVSADPGDVLIDAGFALAVGVGHAEAEHFAAAVAPLQVGASAAPAVRCVAAADRAGRRFALLANLGEDETTVELPAGSPGPAPEDAVTGKALPPAEDRVAVALPARSARLIRQAANAAQDA